MNEMLERLEAAQTRQARFVSDASHELRTPIAVIRHELEIALQTTGTEHWAAVGADVLDEDLRMERLVDDLLFIARHERERTDHAATGVLVDVDDVVLTETRRGAITKTVDITGVSAGQIRGKPDEIARVIRNLLDNALRHARTTVALHVASGGGSVVVDVDDDGPGVPEADRDRVFERFARLDDSRTRTSGGSGLGLAIVGEIVADHHGTVTVTRSPSLGGARFTVTLPDARTITTL
jgi:signal transduction histidine kinase